MSFEKENKIKYKELAPSLQKLIDSKTASTDFLAHTSDKVVHITKDERDNWNGAKSNIDNVLDLSQGNTDNTIKKYIDDNDLLNLPPKVGFYNDRRVPLFGTYNMSFLPYNGKTSYVTTDLQGFEVAYFTASNGSGNDALFKASRISDNSEFVYSNTPVITGLSSDTVRARYCHGLGNDFIIISMLNVTDSSVKYILYKTYGKSDPSTWLEYKDITSLVVKDGFTFVNGIYNTAHNTIAIFFKTNLSFTMNLYKYDDLSLIKEGIAIIDLKDVITAKTASSISCNEIIKTTDCIGFNPDLNQLILLGNVVSRYTLTSPICEHKKYVATFTVSPLFMFNGTGAITKLIATDQYDLVDLGIGIDNDIDQRGYSITYDDYEQCIRISSRTLWDYKDTIKRFPSSLSITGKEFWDKYNNQIVNIPPDSNPWAKYIYRSLQILNGRLYFVATSKKFGVDKDVQANFENLLGANRNIQIKPGEWRIIDSSVEKDYSETKQFKKTCCVYNGNAVMYYQVTPGEKIKQVIVDADGTRSLVDTAYTAPNMPDVNVIYLGVGAYNSLNKRVYYMVCDKVASVGSEQGYPYLLMYDFTTSMFSEVRSLSPSVKSAMTESMNARKLPPKMTPASNIFIDSSNNLYFFYYATLVGWGITSNVVKVSSFGDMADTGINPGPYYGDTFIGYDSKVGYYLTTNEGTQVYISMVMSKDLSSVGADKTITEFFSGSYYKAYIRLASTTGLVAYLQNVAMFLGGYLSNIPQQEIPLLADSDNYIYLVRDRTDRTKINIKVRDKIIGVIGENAFNRVLISKLTTDSGNIITQTDYDITNYIEAEIDALKNAKPKVAILTGTISNGGTIPLPDGYTQDQCRWMVSVNVVSEYYFSSAGWNLSSWYPNTAIGCAADSNRVVTIYATYALPEGGEALGTKLTNAPNCTANYMIIGVK